jgi:hypothetical protein
MTPEEQAARDKHPAGKKMYSEAGVPLPGIPAAMAKNILEYTARVVEGNHFLYGAKDSQMPTRGERWDTRTILDYAVLCEPEYELHAVVFAHFYYVRNECMKRLLDALACEPGQSEKPNLGDWRMWETDEHRTAMDIVRIIKRAINAEKAMTI